MFPAFDQGSFTSTDLGLGAAVTAADLVPPGTSAADSSVFLLVRFAPGPAQAREVRSLGKATATFCSGVQQSTCFVTRQPPFDIGNYARIEGVPAVPGTGVGCPRRGGAGTIDDRLGPTAAPRLRHPQDDRICPSPGLGARGVAGRDIRCCFVDTRDPARNPRRPRRLGPVCERTRNRDVMGGAGRSRRAVHSCRSPHRHNRCRGSCMVRQPRAARPGLAGRIGVSNQPGGGRTPPTSARPESGGGGVVDQGGACAGGRRGRSRPSGGSPR